MSERERRCAGTNTSGEPCGAHASFVGPDGWCPAHAPGGRQRLREAGQRGAEASARARRAQGLDPDELPELRAPKDAQRLLELVARAVAEGRLGHRQGDAVTRTVRAWLVAHEQGEVRERMERLREQVDELRKGGLKAV